MNMMRLVRDISIGTAALVGGLCARGDVTLPAIFGSHMVLQQGGAIPVWGQAEAGEEVTVTLGQNTAKTTADAQGNWRVSLPESGVARGLTLSVAGRNTVTFDDVAVGEVWLASGQSNMEMGVGVCLDPEKEIAAADYPDIRLIDVPKLTAPLPQRDFSGAWVRCSPETLGKHGTWGGFSAAAFYFGRELHKVLGVPIGLIDSSWGGSAIEPWTPPEGFRSIATLPDLSRRVEIGTIGTAAHRQAAEEAIAATAKWLVEARAALAAETVVTAPPGLPGELAPLAGYGDPTAMYNAMIAPLVPYALRGAIWYQGESNHGDGMAYVEKTKALVQGWRQLWGRPTMPYYFVQIAPWPYGEEDPSRLPLFWEAQAAIERTIPHTGMAVIHDVGDLADIHPRNKQEVGRRLALLALNETYARNDVVCRGPLFRELTIEPGRLRVTFDHAEGGLKTRDGEAPSHFEIIGENGEFVPAKAVVEGAAVLLSAEAVRTPAAVRFAWHKLATPNLVNQAGLPATAFRAGEVPVRAPLDARVPEARGYALVYSLRVPEIPYADGRVVYDVDRRQEVTGRFDRVAYYLETRRPDGSEQFVFVSMEAFTDDLDKIGVPAVGTQARFQQAAANLQIRSNVPAVASGDGIAGQIEFWPCDYGPENAAKVVGASESAYDFGDRIADNVPDGYGSMQVHNPAARQVVFAYNNWKAKGGGDIGIGNAPSGHPDWTFSKSAGSYAAARLQVLVRLAQ
jgi:sialate O-acetylesterase